MSYVIDTRPKLGNEKFPIGMVSGSLQLPSIPWLYGVSPISSLGGSIVLVHFQTASDIFGHCLVSLLQFHRLSFFINISPHWTL